MVEVIWVKKSGPPGSPQKLSIKMAGSNFPKSAIETINNVRGTNFAIVTTTLIPVASLTPRDTKNAINHKKIEAQIREGRLLPAPKTGKK